MSAAGAQTRIAQFEHGSRERIRNGTLVHAGTLRRTSTTARSRITSSRGRAADAISLTAGRTRSGALHCIGVEDFWEIINEPPHRCETRGIPCKRGSERVVIIAPPAAYNRIAMSCRSISRCYVCSNALGQGAPCSAIRCAGKDAIVSSHSP